MPFDKTASRFFIFKRQKENGMDLTFRKKNGNINEPW